MALKNIRFVGGGTFPVRRLFLRMFTPEFKNKEKAFKIS